MDKEFNPQQISNLLKDISEKGGYSLSELIERLPTLIAFYQGLKLTEHEHYPKYLDSKSLSPTTRTIVHALDQASKTLRMQKEIKSLNPSYKRNA